MGSLISFEGWVVAHKPTGEEVVTVEDRDGQCKGGGRRVTFTESCLEVAKIHLENCPFCRTDQRLASVEQVRSTNLI
jgi:hypothetical protein